MEIIDTWPEFELPETVTQALKKHLTDPFENEAEAIACWQESATQIIILGSGGTIPEYTEALPEGYSISLVITSDAGDGIYYVLPPVQEI